MCSSDLLVLVGQFSAGVSSALADETCCVSNVKTEYPLATSLRPLSDAVPGWSTAYRVEQLGKNGVKLVASGGENSYAFSLMGSNAVSDADTRTMGDAWRTSVGLEAESTIGTLLQTDVHARFTELERSPGDQLFRSEEHTV